MRTKEPASNLPHLHHTSKLPRHWVTLPQTVRQLVLGHPLTAGLFPSHVGFFPEARQHLAKRPQGIDSTVFNYCLHGVGWCKLDGVYHDVPAGHLMVVPRMIPHEYGTSERRPWTLSWFHAIGTTVDDVVTELGITRGRPVVELGTDRRLIELLVELQQELEEDIAWPTLLYASQLLGHIVGLMIRLARKHPTTPDSRQRVLSSVETMKDHLARPLDLVKLAATAGLSPSHYAAMFRQLIGRSPGQYFNQLRIHHAAQLLATTHEPIQDVARRIGFEDPLYFSRAFRRVQGISPSQFRAQSLPL